MYYGEVLLNFSYTRGLAILELYQLRFRANIMPILRHRITSRTNDSVSVIVKNRTSIASPLRRIFPYVRAYLTLKVTPVFDSGL